MTQQLYGSDASRMRLREIRRFLPGVNGLFTWLLLRSRLVRAPVTLDQRVLPLWADTLSSWDALRPVDHAALRPCIDALTAGGFVGIAVHRLVEPVAGTDGAGAYLLHPSGTAFAFIGHVTKASTGRTLLATHVATALADGRMVSTTNLRASLDYSCSDDLWVDGTPADVARAHEQRLAGYQGRIWPITGAAALAQLVDLHTTRSFEERVQRGVFVVGTPSSYPSYAAPCV